MEKARGQLSAKCRKCNIYIVGRYTMKKQLKFTLALALSLALLFSLEVVS